MADKIITQFRLKEVLEYDPTTGIFIRLVANSNRVKVGDIAGWYCGNGYLYIHIDGRKYLSHRLAWLYMTGKFPAEQIDHINHVRDDNRIDNLRCVTNTYNQRNATKNRNNTSGVTGVSWSKVAKKWWANIWVDGKNVHLGFFVDMQDAINARKSAEVRYGYHPNHGS